MESRNEFIGFKGFCERLGISHSTGRRLYTEKKIASIRIGSKVFFTERIIQEFLDRSTVQAETSGEI